MSRTLTPSGDAAQTPNGVVGIAAGVANGNGAGRSRTATSASSVARAFPVLVPQDLLAGRPDVPLNKAITVVGTADTCRLVLDSRTVSRHHAVFLVDGPTAFVADLASRTGVLVNGRAVHEAELLNGDRVQIGKFAFRFRGAAPSAAHRPAPPAPAAAAVVAGLLAVSLPGRVALIGRRETSDVALVADAGVSAAHAALFHVGGQWYVRDLGSRTGTRVNGKPVTQAAINVGDGIGVGVALIQFQAAAALPDHVPVLPLPIKDTAYAGPDLAVTFADDATPDIVPDIAAGAAAGTDELMLGADPTAPSAVEPELPTALDLPSDPAVAPADLSLPAGVSFAETDSSCTHATSTGSFADRPDEPLSAVVAVDELGTAAVTTTEPPVVTPGLVSAYNDELLSVQAEPVEAKPLSTVLDELPDTSPDTDMPPTAIDDAVAETLTAAVPEPAVATLPSSTDSMMPAAGTGDGAPASVDVEADAAPATLEPASGFDATLGVPPTAEAWPAEPLDATTVADEMPEPPPGADVAMPATVELPDESFPGMPLTADDLEDDGYGKMIPSVTPRAESPATPDPVNEADATHGVAVEPAPGDSLGELSDFVFVPGDPAVPVGITLPDQLYWGDGEDHLADGSPPTPRPVPADDGSMGTAETVASLAIPSPEAVAEQLLTSGMAEVMPAHEEVAAVTLASGFNAEPTPGDAGHALSDDFAIHAGHEPPVTAADAAPDAEDTWGGVAVGVGSTPDGTLTADVPDTALPAVGGSDVANHGAAAAIADGSPLAPADPLSEASAEPLPAEGLDPSLALGAADAAGSTPPVVPIAFDDLMTSAEPIDTPEPIPPVMIDVGTVTASEVDLGGPTVDSLAGSTYGTHSDADHPNPTVSDGSAALTDEPAPATDAPASALAHEAAVGFDPEPDHDPTVADDLDLIDLIEAEEAIADDHLPADGPLDDAPAVESLATGTGDAAAPAFEAAATETPVDYGAVINVFDAVHVSDPATTLSELPPTAEPPETVTAAFEFQRAGTNFDDADDDLALLEFDDEPLAGLPEELEVEAPPDATSTAVVATRLPPIADEVYPTAGSPPATRESIDAVPQPASPPPPASQPTAFGFAFEGGSFIGGMPISLNGGPTIPLPPDGLVFDTPGAAPPIPPVIDPSTNGIDTTLPRSRPALPTGSPMGLTGAVRLPTGGAAGPPPVPPVGLTGLGLGGSFGAAGTAAAAAGVAGTVDVFSQMAGPIGVEAFAPRPRAADPFHIPEVARSGNTAGDDDPSAPTAAGAAMAGGMAPPPVQAGYYASVEARRASAFARRSSKVRRWVVLLFLVPALWVAGVYAYVSRQVTVVGTLMFDGMDNPAVSEGDRHKFFGTQASKLSSEDVRNGAYRTLIGQRQPPGPTADSTAMDQVIQGPVPPFQPVANYSGLQFTYVGASTAAAGQAQVRALLSALRVADAKLDDDRADARQKLDAARRAADEVRARVEQIGRARQTQDKAAMGGPDPAALADLDADASAADQRVTELTAQTSAVRDRLDAVRHRDTSKPIDPEADPDVIALRQQLETVNKRIALAKRLAPLGTAATTRPADGDADDVNPMLAVIQQQANQVNATLAGRLAVLAADKTVSPSERARAQESAIEALGVQLAGMERRLADATAAAKSAAAAAAAAHAKADAARQAAIAVQDLVTQEYQAKADLQSAETDVRDRQRAVDTAVTVAGTPVTNPTVSVTADSDPRWLVALIGAGVAFAVILFALLSVAGAPLPGE